MHPAGAGPRTRAAAAGRHRQGSGTGCRGPLHGYLTRTGCVLQPMGAPAGDAVYLADASLQCMWS